MKVTPLAADSLGVRSMATAVETDDCKLLLDPSLTIVSERYGLAPHPIEIWTHQKLKERIHLYAKEINIVFISHYHPSHFSREWMDLYSDKTLLIKNPNQAISLSERNLAFTFIQSVQKNSTVDFIDDRVFNFGKTQLIFSKPVRHSTYPQGYTIHCAIKTPRSTFLFLPDMYDWADPQTSDFIIKQDPNFIYINGPLTYKQGDKNSKKYLEQFIQNLELIIESTQIQHIILDHHLLRDLNWIEKIESLLRFVEKRGIHLQTAAAYRGEENSMLEAKRAEYYEKDPP